MKRHDKLADTLPVGTLGILALESSHDMGKRVNDYIVDWRKDRAAQNATASTFAGYNRDSFLIPPARVLVPAKRKVLSMNPCVEMICIY